MRLRAVITVNIAADDYVQAANHQTRLAAFLERLQQDYPDAVLVMRERRERHPDADHESKHRPAPIIASHSG